MLICHCKRVTDTTIREAVRNGARSRGLVGRVCGAGTCCGGCLPAVDEIVEHTQREAQGGLPMFRATG